MCRIDDADEKVQILQERTRAARKPYICYECQKPIFKCELYYYEFGIYDGDAYTFRTCQKCKSIRDWLNSNCSGFVYGEVLADAKEHGYIGELF